MTKTYLSKDKRPVILRPSENTLNIKEVQGELSKEPFETKSSIFVKTKDDDKINICRGEKIP